MIDKRLLKIEIEVGDTIRTYTDLDISASGTKLSNEIPNEFTIKINNLSKDTRDKILTETNILDKNLKKKKISIYAGRVTTGYSLIFKGDIRQATPSQPPDISLTIITYTGDSAKFETTSRSGGEMIKLSILAKQIANDLGLNLVFEATDKQVGSYSYTGSKIKEVEKLNEVGGINAYVDDDDLIVRNKNVPQKGYIFDISKKNGLIGLPLINERGVSFTILFNEQIIIGSKINLTSEINPTANGSWCVYKITYDLQNRNQSFYMKIEATQAKT